MWKKIARPLHIKGLMIEGDKKVSPTRWYNILWMLLFGWKTVAVLSAQSEAEEWLIGFIDFKGRSMVRLEPIIAKEIAVKIGHESCRFFAVSGNNLDTLQEVPLTLVARARVI